MQVFGVLPLSNMYQLLFGGCCCHVDIEDGCGRGGSCDCSKTPSVLLVAFIYYIIAGGVGGGCFGCVGIVISGLSGCCNFGAFPNNHPPPLLLSVIKTSV